MSSIPWSFSSIYKKQTTMSRINFVKNRIFSLEMAVKAHEMRDRINLFNKKIFRNYLYPFPEKSSCLLRSTIERGGCIQYEHVSNSSQRPSVVIPLPIFLKMADYLLCNLKLIIIRTTRRRTALPVFPVLNTGLIIFFKKN